jgi:predicted sulfurtransferase/23S rRNA-/tRNA-specific pseudouridylate synthase
MSAETSIILFYRYHPISSKREIAEIYRLALFKLCNSLELSGRILVASSDSEGINGTLAGSKPLVEAFTHALLGPQYLNKTEDLLRPFLETFWHDCAIFSHLARVPILTMVSPDDFKWSTSDKSPLELFPDLNIKLVNELIGTGGLLSQIPVEETSQGYLTPTKWHEALRDRNPDDSILIDCRNTKECQIGHFQQAVDPGTTTFCQFPQWVRDNQASLEGKKVFMYCTGGIRCEKASAYIRKVVSQVKEVHHLKGGIHKYLEAFPNRDSLWKGKNFVFDGRTSQLVTHTGLETNALAHQDIDAVVGQCVYCKGPFDSFQPENVCTVCREPTLVCNDCKRREIHCRAHFHLRNCYFHDLTPFTKSDLHDQLRELEQHLVQIAIGRKFKQKRKTLQKQCDKIRAFLDNRPQNCEGESLNVPAKCRNCGDSDCSGACWGFHGLKRKERLEDSKLQLLTSDKKSRIERRKANERTSKESRRHLMEQEILQQGLKAPASSYRDATTGLRIPCPCVRVIETNVKGKWCGKSILDVVQQEFVDVYKDLDNILWHGLLRVNHVAVSRENNIVLKNMDAVQRFVHWHEPPVLVPQTISVQHILLPRAVILEYSLADDSAVVVCDKPATVPVHPTGPYLANSLTLMVEAQEGLAKALKPCHRLDRATSGLTICATDVRVSRLIQGTMMEERGVKKLYIAKVHGKFDADTFNAVVDTTAAGVQVTVLDNDHGIRMVEICAPIEVADASAGVRSIASSAGKECTSRFRLVDYNVKEGTSWVVCHPITGRGHQLRVHLKSLGHPIVGDILYGGWNIGDAEIPKDVVIAGIQNSLEGRRIDGHTEENCASISADDVRSVESSCRSCRNGRDGIQASFSDAQLLRGGHSICLHALRYEIVFRKPKDATLVVGTLEMEVELPPWADRIVDATKLSWLL